MSGWSLQLRRDTYTSFLNKNVYDYDNTCDLSLRGGGIVQVQLTSGFLVKSGFVISIVYERARKISAVSMNAPNATSAHSSG